MNKFRFKRFQKFFELFNITNDIKILDVGGLPYDWIELGYKGKVICVSLSKLREGDWGSGNISYFRQDATSLPFRDKSFDVVYSNSLIEHVGRENQVKVAKEIERVSDQYWIQSPNRNFPIEPHYSAPFYHQLPFALRRLIATYWTPIFDRRNCYLSEVDTIYLLTLLEMQALFPDSTVIEEKYFGLTKSIIALKKL